MTVVIEFARIIGKGADMRLLDLEPLFDRLVIPGPSLGLVAGLELLEDPPNVIRERCPPGLPAPPGPVYELE